MLDANTHTVFISDRENGEKKGSYFILENKFLVYKKNDNGSNYTIRKSYFYLDYIASLCQSEDGISKKIRSDFSLSYKDETSPTVQYITALNKDNIPDGPYIEYKCENNVNTARPLIYDAGKSNNMGWPYNCGDIERDGKMAEHIKKPLPYWLQDACFRQNEQNKDWLFMKTPQLLGQNTAYGMRWIINPRSSEASLEVSAFTNWMKPTGFLQ